MADALADAAGRTDCGAIVYLDEQGRPRSQSYSELLDDAARVLGSIRRAGALPGDQVAIQVEQEADLLAAFWACQLGGFVPVPVAMSPPPSSPLSSAELLGGVCDLLQDPWVIAAEPTPGSWLGAVEDLRSGPPERGFHAAEPDDLALLLLTSGSTGLPKAVMLTQRNILSRARANAQVRGLSERNRTFNWMPLDHVGGLVMFHVRDVLLGCHQVHARKEWVTEDPLRWLAAISEHECDTTWAPNFAFGLINDRADDLAGRPWDLSRLTYIMNGGEAIKPKVIRRFLSLLAPFGLPGTAMHPGWGMSETSSGVVDSVFSPDTSSDDDRFVSVGSPHPGVSLRVVDETGRALSEGQIGRLHVTGIPISPGYYRNDEQNRQSFNNDGWFKTGDLAFISNGVLTVTGRVDDVIVVNGVTYYGHEIESVIEELSFVEPSYTVACEAESVLGATAAGTLMIFFHPRSGVASDRDNWCVVEHIADRFGLTVSRVCPVAKESVPKTGIGKLKRSQLARRLSNTEISTSDGLVRAASEEA
ncbi:AMP-binding protein [Halopolyspora algeriensis]|uniref:AMP-binding protein n=1 Tax=Halopolyspora algeriensis TaxID=1500506 RepID=UPI001314462B|nr:AMP-binding protein [Halopolyspora algeriensis]